MLCVTASMVSQIKFFRWTLVSRLRYYFATVRIEYRKEDITKYNLPVALFFVFMFFSTTACAMTFKGRVIDADTKEPIEGAVVVASWYEERATVAGPSSQLKDVKETLTDENGKWVIKGPRGMEGGNITAIFTFLTGTYYTRPPEFIIFKPGYCSWPAGLEIDACKGKMKGYGKNYHRAISEIIELPKLTERKDRLRNLPGPVSGEGADEKQKKFIELINKESRNLGLKGSY